MKAGSVPFRQMGCMMISVLIMLGAIYVGDVLVRLLKRSVSPAVSIDAAFHGFTAAGDEVLMANTLGERIKSIGSIEDMRIEVRKGGATVTAVFHPDTDAGSAESRIKKIISSLRNDYPGMIGETIVRHAVSPVSPPCDESWLPVGDRLLCAAVWARKEGTVCTR